jgi:hypothetical protein
MNPTIEVAVESSGPERARADVGLAYITGHSGWFVMDPHCDPNPLLGDSDWLPQSRGRDWRM